MNLALKPLSDQLCLVTGATRGLGKAIALALGKSGATVIATATSEDRVKRIDEYLNDAAIPGAGKVLDVTDEASVIRLMQEIKDSFGAPSILVNNAGITRDNLLLRMKEAEWDIIMETNLKSAYRLSKMCLRGMTKMRYGRIINIASVVAVAGNPGQTNYAAAKAGLIGFSKSLAQEVASRNITVNSIAPGFIETDMTDKLSDEQRNALYAKIPLGRFGTPQDIASAVVFLVSPSGDYITGTTLHINGGMAMF